MTSPCAEVPHTSRSDSNAAPSSLHRLRSWLFFLAWSGEGIRCKRLGGDPGGVCRASSTCCLSSLAHRGADSLDAGGQLLTGPTARFYVAPLRGASEGQLLRACKDVSGGGGGQGVGKEAWGTAVLVGLHAFHRRSASGIYNYTLR